MGERSERKETCMLSSAGLVRVETLPWQLRKANKHQFTATTGTLRTILALYKDLSSKDTNNRKNEWSHDLVPKLMEYSVNFACASIASASRKWYRSFNDARHQCSAEETVPVTSVSTWLIRLIFKQKPLNTSFPYKPIPIIVPTTRTYWYFITPRKFQQFSSKCTKSNAIY